MTSGLIERERLRIRKGVRPYGGRLLEVVSREGDFVRGWVQLGTKVATAIRLYRADELEQPGRDRSVRTRD